MACVYIASAVKACRADTLSINNFGAYLRNIDSTAIPQYRFYSMQINCSRQSPLILTQLGNSYFELNDMTRPNFIYKQALK